jgi:hypothetical protein
VSVALAEAAHTLRFADADGAITTPVKPEQLLQARCQDDIGMLARPGADIDPTRPEQLRVK